MNCCFKTVKTTAIEIAGPVLELVIPDMDLKHGQRIRVCFAQNPPAITTPGPLKVEIALNGQKIPAIQGRMIGAPGAVSFLYSDQLATCCDGKIKARQYIDLVFSADTISFNYCGPCRCLPRANIEFPRISAPTPAKDVSKS